MDGKQVGIRHGGRINEIINDLRQECEGDPVALAQATSYISRLLSLSNGDSPVTQVLRGLRREAILDLSDHGLSDEKIAEVLRDADVDITRQRVSQIRKSPVEGPRKNGASLLQGFEFDRVNAVPPEPVTAIGEGAAHAAA
jgi:hypothetical protein